MAKEAFADIETTQEEAAAQTGCGASRSRTVQNRRPEHADVKRRQRAITDFVDWYCSEPRLAFNRTVVLGYRIYLEQKQYAATTINFLLAAVRRVAFEATDSGLLSPGTGRLNSTSEEGAPDRSSRGDWLIAEQSKRLLAGEDRASLCGKRNYPILAMLPGCGLPRRVARAARLLHPVAR